MLPHSSPESNRPISSRHSSSELSSEIAPEIVVWTEDMDVDSTSHHDDSEDLSGMDASTDGGNNNAEDADLLQATNNNDDAAATIFESSLSALTDLSDISSLPSTQSSKATTPIDTEALRNPPEEIPSEATQHIALHRSEIERLTFITRPKSSIPTDITSRQYASECVAAAEGSRLNPYALHHEEYHLFRHHISHSQVTTYLNIRNGILRQWMRQPWVGVSRQEAVGYATARWFDAASVCFDWLVRRGYINYGCVDVPETNLSSKPPSLRKGKTIAVIGAGISGLACARQLECLFKQYADRFHERGEEPPKVVVLEGRGRVGGRVYSREFKTKPAHPQPGFAGKRHTAEMGGMIITGFDRGNPMNILVRGQLGIPYHALTADTTIYDSNGKPVDPVRDQLVEKLYNDCLDRVSEFKHNFQPSKLIEGNRALIEDGRDSPGDGTKTIMQAEEATAALPHAPPVSEQSVPEKVNMVPVSSDKITGRVHNQPGVPATSRALDKAKAMGWSLRRGASEDDNIDLGEAVREQDATLGSVLNHAISQYKRLVDLTAQDHRLINWHIANLEYSNATNLHNLSLGLWDIDAGNEWEGPHTMVVGGYQSVARGLLQCPTSLNLRTNFPVKGIKYQGDSFSGPAAIESEDGQVVETDAVVCTIPLGVLKQGNVAFEPALPQSKADVIKRLGFGILNKVVLVYEKVFWEPDRHIFGVLRDATIRHSTSQGDYSTNRGRFFQWFNVTNTTGLPCLIALMAGDAGFDTEHSSNDSLIVEATEVLRRVFGNDVPYPVEAVVTRWGSDRFARGSYSSASPAMQPEDYDIMARHQGNLFFAGEHTIGTHPATVHGAYLSGLRAASEILEAMIGPIEVPTPLVLPRDSLLLHKRKEAVKDPRQARLDAYEAEVWEYVRSKIGDRPARPGKVAGNAYLLFSKSNFEIARKRCDENRKPGKSKSMPNEVRVMTSKMWKEATPEERKPYEEQAAEQKKAYALALAHYTEVAERWDREAIALRAVYEEEHPSQPGPDEVAETQQGPQKHRRSKKTSYMEDSDVDM
ncbi:lysine-specific histone demethylase 1 [Stachybotrys elegans]|uniref:Lysine-specific histone demethylase 1 n=1 Tax=Stachybotrys elegans TaxID=80388 RepID=A0A8K0T8G8_9HYPO|nr:lysine-specific histone demethylase 1 [Stachybotrys elegans]